MIDITKLNTIEEYEKLCNEFNEYEFTSLEEAKIFLIENKQEEFSTKLQDYFGGNSLSINSWGDKYALNEQEKEYPAYVFLRLAYEGAKLEVELKNQVYWMFRWFNEFFYGIWRPGGSITAAIGNSKNISIANCTTFGFDDDSLEAINKVAYKQTKSAAYRQGLGVHMAPLRPRGARVNNAAQYSTGSVEWMRFLNSIGNYTGQKGRIPAFLFSQNISHPDIREFISCKKDHAEMQNANISTQFTDAFFNAVLDKKEWRLEYTVQSSGEIISKIDDAEDLFNLFSQSNWESAEPGSQFIDTITKWATTNVFGTRYRVVSSNVCSEKMMCLDSGCVLSSLNLGILPQIDYKKYIELISPSLVRYTDNCITYELINKKSPYQEQHDVVEALREIGIGYTNLHGFLLQYNIGYDSEEGKLLIEDITKTFSIACWKENIKLGKEKGSFPAFDKLKEKYPETKSDYINELNEKKFKNKLCESLFFKKLIDEVGLDITHLRCAQTMSVAPTGTLSMTFPYWTPIDSSGIEPITAFWYWRRARTSGEYKWYFTIPDCVCRRLKNEGYSEVSSSVEDPTGKHGEYWIPIIEKYFNPEIFKPAHHIDPLQKVKLMEKVAPWIDSSISTTYNLKESATIQDVKDIYLAAWKTGVIKAVSIYRDKSRQGILEFESPLIVEKRFKKEGKQELKGIRPTEMTPQTAGVKRPKQVECEIHRTVVRGIKYILLIGLVDGHPYEIFGTHEEDLYIPANIEKAIITKVRKGQYNLEIQGEKDPVIVDISKHINNGVHTTITRLISTLLRHRVSVNVVCEQLDKIDEDITSLGRAIRRKLVHYSENSVKGIKCNTCGSENIIFKDGCQSCMDCGNSKCS
jgi:ribonucleoside-diphosphate reductase alpha chain